MTFYSSRSTFLPCTCAIPGSVSISMTTTTADNDARKQLQSNLELLGWSPIQCQNVGVVSPSRERIRSLFSDASTTETTKRSSKLKYRSMESGGTEQAIEPKESLELELSKLMETDDTDSDTTYRQVKEWCESLSNIAHTVNSLLDIPPNTFLLNDDNHNNPQQTQQPLDLLRVFYYHAVPQNSNLRQQQQQQQQLGSSPHTDWGTWTVVWQDDCGGLETYCRHCQRWIAVPPTSSTTSTPNDTTWNCIIHVGDMASLALGTDLPPPSQSDDFNNLPSNLPTEANSQQQQQHKQQLQILWPSPRHRVISPSHRDRTSLVYFAYPPPLCSMNEMKEVMMQQCYGYRLPLEEYYLLQNQSNEEKNAAATAASIYNKLQSLTIRDAIQAKWNQVQRS